MKVAEFIYDHQNLLQIDLNVLKSIFKDPQKSNNQQLTLADQGEDHYSMDYPHWNRLHVVRVRKKVNRRQIRINTDKVQK